MTRSAGGGKREARGSGVRRRGVGGGLILARDVDRVKRLPLLRTCVEAVLLAEGLAASAGFEVRVAVGI